MMDHLFEFDAQNRCGKFFFSVSQACLSHLLTLPDGNDVEKQIQADNTSRY